MACIYSSLGHFLVCESAGSGLQARASKFSLDLGLVSFGSGDETSLGQHSMDLPSLYLISPHFKTLPCRSVFAINYAIKYWRQ